jgi:osmotically-inducible protein OsmY
MPNIRFLLIVLLAVVVTGCGGATDTTSGNAAAAQDADNTARNETDNSEAAKTPFDQSEDPAALEISANIRKAVLADDSLSLNAHNVKIITNAGVVTLRGPVKSAAEKTAIEMKAKQVAGVTQVENLLEIEAN